MCQVPRKKSQPTCSLMTPFWARPEQIEFKKELIERKFRYQKELEEKDQQDSILTTNQDAKQTQGTSNTAKLPKLTITKFDGTYLDWNRFWGQFTEAIDKTGHDNEVFLSQRICGSQGAKNNRRAPIYHGRVQSAGRIAQLHYTGCVTRVNNVSSSQIVCERVKVIQTLNGVTYLLLRILQTLLAMVGVWQMYSCGGEAQSGSQT